jgi:hypothetical protein
METLAAREFKTFRILELSAALKNAILHHFDELVPEEGMMIKKVIVRPRSLFHWKVVTVEQHVKPIDGESVFLIAETHKMGVPVKEGLLRSVDINEYVRGVAYGSEEAETYQNCIQNLYKELARFN